MANFTLRRVDLFPSGTTVEARKASLFGTVGPNRGVAPPGAAETTAVSDGISIAFTGLTGGAEYVFSGQVGGQWVHTAALTQATTTDGELDYKELTGTFTTTGVTAASAQDVTGMSTLQFTMPALKPVLLDLLVPSFTVNAAGLLLGVIIAKLDNTVIGQFFNVPQGSGISGQIVGRKRLTTADFAADSLVQLKLRAYVQTGATSGSLLGTPTAPTSLRASQG